MANRDKTSQSDRFIDAARELGCDETEEAFAEKVRKAARASVPTPAATRGSGTPRAKRVESAGD